MGTGRTNVAPGQTARPTRKQLRPAIGPAIGPARAWSHHRPPAPSGTRTPEGVRSPPRIRRAKLPAERVAALDALGMRWT